MEVAKPITPVSIAPGAGRLPLRAREVVMFEIRTILYPTDFSDESAAAFGVACSLAKKHGAEVVVLHVAPNMAFGEFADQAQMVEEEELLMDDSLRPIQSPEPGVRVRHQLERGDAAELIVSVAQDLSSDLIVM